MNQFSQYTLGDMRLSYWTDDQNHVGMRLVPLAKESEIAEKNCKLEPLVQLYVRGDKLPASYGNGRTMSGSDSTARMKLVSQNEQDGKVVTVLSDSAGRTVRHTAAWHEGLQALRVWSEFVNETGEALTLEMLSSMSLGGLTPFDAGDAPGALWVHRAKSSWSMEGRILSESVEDLQLEPSWTNYGYRVEKFGVRGSMPVNGYFPFAAVEDRRAGVTWAMQIACPSSWQIEFRRLDSGLSLTGGGADFDYCHWAKNLAPGESFRTPEAYLTVGCGGVDEASQRLLSIQWENFTGKDHLPPVLYNEYCTTWGKPSHENLSKIVASLKGRDIDYLVIDCGWFGKPGVFWGECSGDWEPNTDTMFPEGLEKTVEMIRSAGFRPGIWFEPETCGPLSDMAKQEDFLLKRNGYVVDSEDRRFLDMQKPEVKEYLEERVVNFLRKYRFEYVKIDYNNSIGDGCDGAESLGEGLRRNMEASQAFYRHLREAVSGICMENCSSGGHRLEPSMMALFDMASFSDAHECIEIPIVAANLQRLILPAQSQIWAVLHGTDSLRRLNYSLVSTFLGVLCLSGDIYSLSQEQWDLVDRAIRFYRSIRGIVLRGASKFYGSGVKSWRHPEGWQAVCRTGPDGVLVTIHTFGGEIPEQIALPVKAKEICGTLCTEGNQVALKDGVLTVSLHSNFEAVAVSLK